MGPLYVGTKPMHPGHIHSSVIQRSARQSALGRLAYQACTSFEDDFRKADYSQFSEHHRGHVILLPEDAPPEFAEMENFLMATAFRETRIDAQEGRAVDFSIPRAVPEALLLPVAAFTMAPFVRLGMAAWIDVECPPASDGELNPHCHVYLSQRVLEEDGFGKKQRDWNRFFRRDKGRYFRALVAGRLTLACAFLGIGAHVDPRRNDETGAGDTEERLPPVLWRILSEGGRVEPIEMLNQRRRSKARAAMQGITPVHVSDGRVSIRSAVSLPGNRVRAVAAIKTVVDTAPATSLAVENLSAENHSHLTPVRLNGTGVVFDGDAFHMAAEGRTQDAALIVSLARALGWPALVVEGDARLADMVIVAGAPEGLTAVNRAASPTAIALISKVQFGMFDEQVSRHDPRRVIAAAVREFVPPSSQAVSPPPDDLEGLDLLPDTSSWEVQRDQVAQAHGAQPTVSWMLSRGPHDERPRQIGSPGSATPRRSGGKGPSRPSPYVRASPPQNSALCPSDLGIGPSEVRPLARSWGPQGDVRGVSEVKEPPDNPKSELDSHLECGWRKGWGRPGI
jgi:hypothetical protein